MVRKKQPAPPPPRIREAVAQIEIPDVIPFDEVQDVLAGVVKDLKKHKITQADICGLLEQDSGNRYTEHHLRNNILRVDSILYKATAAWVLQCLGFPVDIAVIKTPKGEDKR